MRKSIIDTLRRLEAEEAVSMAQFNVQHSKLRKELVEKYGEDGVSKVDAKIEREWKERIEASK